VSRVLMCVCVGETPHAADAEEGHFPQKWFVMRISKLPLNVMLSLYLESSQVKLIRFN